MQITTLMTENTWLLLTQMVTTPQSQLDSPNPKLAFMQKSESCYSNNF